jgi:hypothetical protein
MCVDEVGPPIPSPISVSCCACCSSAYADATAPLLVRRGGKPHLLVPGALQLATPFVHPKAAYDTGLRASNARGVSNGAETLVQPKAACEHRMHGACGERAGRLATRGMSNARGSDTQVPSSIANREPPPSSIPITSESKKRYL